MSAFIFNPHSSLRAVHSSFHRVSPPWRTIIWLTAKRFIWIAQQRKSCSVCGVLAFVPGGLAGMVIAYRNRLTKEAFSGHAVAFTLHPAPVIGGMAFGFLVVRAAAWSPTRPTAVWSKRSRGYSRGSLETYTTTDAKD